MAKTRLAKRYRRNKNRERTSSLVNNPAVLALQDLALQVVPAFGGYASSRLLSRVAQVQVGKRWGRWGKHAGAAASVVSFLGALFGLGRVKALERYADQIVVGTGVGMIQTLVQTYLPFLGWITADVQPEAHALPAPGPGAASSEIPMSADDSDYDTIDNGGNGPAPSWGTYNDANDQGRHTTDAPTQESADTAEADATMDGILADMGMGADAGIFTN